MYVTKAFHINKTDKLVLLLYSFNILFAFIPSVLCAPPIGGGVSSVLVVYSYSRIGF